MNTTKTFDPFHQSTFDRDDLATTLLAPITAWWAAGPRADFTEHGFVAVVLEPGDMTHYALTIADVTQAGFKGRPDLAVTCFEPYGRSALIRIDNIPPAQPDESHYLCDRLGLDDRYEPARVMVTHIARLAAHSRRFADRLVGP